MIGDRHEVKNNQTFNIASSKLLLIQPFHGGLPSGLRAASFYQIGHSYDTQSQALGPSPLPLPHHTATFNYFNYTILSPPSKVSHRLRSSKQRYSWQAGATLFIPFTSVRDFSIFDFVLNELNV
jgi:hypothetical protein